MSEHSRVTNDTRRGQSHMESDINVFKQKFKTVTSRQTVKSNNM